MPETSLVVVDPGHFHATLVQQQMYPELSPVVRVYAPHPGSMSLALKTGAVAQPPEMQ